MFELSSKKNDAEFLATIARIRRIEEKMKNLRNPAPPEEVAREFRTKF